MGDCKAAVFFMIHVYMILYTWTHSDCDSMHKTFSRSTKAEDGYRGGVVMKIPCLPEKLLAFDISLERENQFSLQLWSLEDVDWIPGQIL